MPERVVAEHSTNIPLQACIISTCYLDIFFKEAIASMLQADGKQWQSLFKSTWAPRGEQQFKSWLYGNRLCVRLPCGKVLS